MDNQVYALCPRCGKRARIISHRWDWDQDQDYAQLRCDCGRSELPYLESRIIDINLRNPYMKQCRFRLLIPPGLDRDNMWNKIGKCLTDSWNHY